jgi:LysR family transcriptional regulator, regulator for genes of the gallate degradation pathway
VSEPKGPGGAAALPNLRHLRLFDVAVRERSMSRAAGRVHISQPAASQALARLAQVFGARLLERVGNSVSTTAEGRIVAARVRRALDHLGDLDRCFARSSRRHAAPSNPLERYASTSQLRALATVAATGSFAAAGRRLGQSDSSVQRACREVERIISIALFEGGQHSRALTRRGRSSRRGRAWR